MRYTLFNQDGSHAANIECHPDDAPYQAQDGQAIIEGDCGDGCYYDGVSVCEKPAQPSPSHEWIGLAWVLNDGKRMELFEQSKAEALQAIAKKHAAMLSSLTGSATLEERDTWQLKLDAATASINDGSPTDAAITMFHDEAEADGVTIMIKCERTMQKSQAYKLLIGIASGIKTRAENTVNAAENVDQVNAALHQALIDAQAAAAQYLFMIGRST